MMHRAWCCLEEVPYCFQGHQSHFKVTRLKIVDFDPIWAFPDYSLTPVWIHQWLWNNAQSLKQHRRDILLFFKVIRQFSRSRRTKNANFDPNCSFSDCNSSLNLPMALKCCTTLNVVQKRYPIVFQGHPSNFKVTWDKKSRRFWPELSVSGL